MNIKQSLKQNRVVRYFYFKSLSIIQYIEYIYNYIKFNRLLVKTKQQPLLWKNRYVCLNDKTSKTSYDTHYVYHTAWAARKLQEIMPAKHIDISSSIYFNAIVSAFIPIEFYDFRPANIQLKGLSPYAGNILSLPFADNSIDSLSCMHVLEHIGLGRYGDSLDAQGDLKAVNELVRVLGNNGNLLIVVPVGKPTICYNAHRIYGYDEVLLMFHKLSLQEFTLLTDDIKGPQFIAHASAELVEEQEYGCGCFWFKKLEN